MESIGGGVKERNGMAGKYGQYKYRMLAELGDYEPEEIRADWLLSANHVLIDERHVESAISIASQEKKIKAGDGVHIFISEDCANVIRNSVRNLEEPEMASFVPEKLCGILYVENEDPSLFECTGDGEKEAYVRLNLDEYGIFTSHAVKGEEYDKDHENMTQTEESAMLDRMRLLYGAFMMMKSFPEMFLDGPPEVMRHPAWYRRLKNKHHMQIERVRGSVAPHIRSGHFRVLRSTYYKHKRGQAVFVKASMIKGKAKHDKQDNQ